MERMEHHVEELQLIDWWHREGQQIDWAARISERREDIRAPDALDDLFCDDCHTFHYRLGVIGEKHVCPSCWDDRGYAAQQQLDTAVTSPPGSPETERVYAIVGCGKDKQDGTHPARELYTAPYFAKKRRWAEELADAWLILSAEHGLVKPDTEIACYDTAIEDVAVDRWLDDVHSFWQLPESSRSNVWILLRIPIEPANAARGTVSIQLPPGCLPSADTDLNPDRNDTLWRSGTG